MIAFSAAVATAAALSVAAPPSGLADPGEDSRLFVTASGGLEPGSVHWLDFGALGESRFSRLAAGEDITLRHPIGAGRVVTMNLSLHQNISPAPRLSASHTPLYGAFGAPRYHGDGYNYRLADNTTVALGYVPGSGGQPYDTRLDITGIGIETAGGTPVHSGYSLVVADAEQFSDAQDRFGVSTTFFRPPDDPASVVPVVDYGLLQTAVAQPALAPGATGIPATNPATCHREHHGATMACRGTAGVGSKVVLAHHPRQLSVSLATTAGAPNSIAVGIMLPQAVGTVTSAPDPSGTVTDGVVLRIGGADGFADTQTISTPAPGQTATAARREVAAPGREVVWTSWPKNDAGGLYDVNWTCNRITPRADGGFSRRLLRAEPEKIAAPGGAPGYASRVSFPQPDGEAFIDCTAEWTMTPIAAPRARLAPHTGGPLTGQLVVSDIDPRVRVIEVNTTYGDGTTVPARITATGDGWVAGNPSVWTVTGEANRVVVSPADQAALRRLDGAQSTVTVGRPDDTAVIPAITDGPLVWNTRFDNADPLVPPATILGVFAPGQLSAEEKKAVAAAVAQANPAVDRGSIAVADNGRVTVTYPDGTSNSLAAELTVTEAPLPVPRIARTPQYRDREVIVEPVAPGLFRPGQIVTVTTGTRVYTHPVSAREARDQRVSVATEALLEGLVVEVSVSDGAEAAAGATATVPVRPLAAAAVDPAQAVAGRTTVTVTPARGTHFLPGDLVAVTVGDTTFGPREVSREQAERGSLEMTVDPLRGGDRIVATTTRPGRTATTGRPVRVPRAVAPPRPVIVTTPVAGTTTLLIVPAAGGAFAAGDTLTVTMGGRELPVHTITAGEAAARFVDYVLDTPMVAGTAAYATVSRNGTPSARGNAVAVPQTLPDVLATPVIAAPVNARQTTVTIHPEATRYFHPGDVLLMSADGLDYQHTVSAEESRRRTVVINLGMPINPGETIRVINTRSGKAAVTGAPVRVTGSGLIDPQDTGGTAPGTPAHHRPADNENQRTQREGSDGKTITRATLLEAVLLAVLPVTWLVASLIGAWAPRLARGGTITLPVPPQAARAPGLER